MATRLNTALFAKDVISIRSRSIEILPELGLWPNYTAVSQFYKVIKTGFEKEVAHSLVFFVRKGVKS
jgi:hypothetical protein